MNHMVIIATLVGVAEAYMMMFCGFRLVGFRPPHRRLLATAFAFAVFVRLARQVLYTVLGAPFGVHMVIAMVTFFVIGYVWFRLPLVLAAIAVVIGDMLLSLGTILVSLLLRDVDPSQPPVLLMLIATEQAPLMLATFAVWKTGISVVPERLTSGMRR